MAAIDALFEVLLREGGSDLHLGVGMPPLIRARGELSPIRNSEVSADEMQRLLYEIITPEQKKTIDEDLDLDFAYAFKHHARFRANYFWKTSGLAAVSVSYTHLDVYKRQILPSGW